MIDGGKSLKTMMISAPNKGHTIDKKTQISASGCNVYVLEPELRFRLTDRCNVVFVAGNRRRQFAINFRLLTYKPVFTFVAVVNMVEIIIPS